MDLGWIVRVVCGTQKSTLYFHLSDVNRALPKCMPRDPISVAVIKVNIKPQIRVRLRIGRVAVGQPVKTTLVGCVERTVLGVFLTSAQGDCGRTGTSSSTRR